MRHDGRSDTVAVVPDTPLWTPTPEQVAETAIDAFRRHAETISGTTIPDSVALHEWSVRVRAEFWRLVWDECAMIGDPGERVLVAGDHMTTDRWFPDARLNVAEHLLRGEERRTAIVFVREDGMVQRVSLGRLRRDVAHLAGYFRAHGIGPGDRVAAWMPNLPETVVTMLAAASLGAVFTSTSADFGAQGVVDRFGQVAPKVLVAADGYHYGGRTHDCLERLAEITTRLPSLEHTLVVGHLTDTPRLDGIAHAQRWTDALAAGAAVDAAETPKFERFGFDHPWYVLYSSGTTGAPKCIVHRTGGVLLKHLSEQRLHCDIRRNDVVCYFTTCGWMMWNWLVSALASETTIVLYDGSPAHPSPDVLFRLAADLRMTFLGTSAKFIDSCRKAGLRPRDDFDLTRLRTIASTGSPLHPDGFTWIYDAVAPNVHLASISGGTDLCGCLVGGDPTRSVWTGEIQGPVLGVDVDVVAADGTSLRTMPGTRGDLVARQSFPSMPIGFWGDDTGERYRATYFERFPGTWAQGDFASWTEHGGMVIHGRSDATLNASGVRIGTAEIYNVVERFDEVTEAVAVAQEWDDDTRIVLLVRLAAGCDLDDDLGARLRSAIRTDCSPRHVPARIAAVADLPRTRSGKLVELAIADVINGRTIRNREALANPEALDALVALPELQE